MFFARPNFGIEAPSVIDVFTGVAAIGLGAVARVPHSSISVAAAA